MRDNVELHRFEVLLGGGVAGFAAYERHPGVVAIVHTEVDPAFEGRGLGSVLVKGALDRIRAEGSALLPFCPFTKAYVGRHREYLDLVPVGERERFGLPSD